MHPDFLAGISAAITDATGHGFSADTATAAAGGSIHASYAIGDGGSRYFAKTNHPGSRDAFAAEAAGLALLAATRCVRVPQVICRGESPHGAYLVLEYLPLSRSGADSQARLGRGLAELHKSESPAGNARFGLDQNNFIGASEQCNTWCDRWVEFFRERRLRFQLELAARNAYDGVLQESGRRLLQGMGALFAGYRPTPSLLHGDLWSGNAGALDDGTPVIFDPAVYYGDREADLAMTELFGGFGREFYAAYDAAWPRDPGYATRRTLYNLYHVLNHLNLFGASYLGQAQRMIAELNSILG